MEKKSYYLGTQDPKDKPKADKRLVVYPGRFKEPFYQNYDLYDTPEGDRGMGPGTGLQGGKKKKYKSIQEFVEEKRKRMKDRYTAVDEYYADDTEKDTKKKGKKSIEKSVQKAARMIGLKLIKNAYDYGNRDYSYPESNDADRFIPGQGFGGVLDRSVPEDDRLGGSPLEFGYNKDYFSNEDNNPKFSSLDEQYAKARKAKKKKKRIAKIYNLLDRMAGRGFYGGYGYGYGGYGRTYNDNRSYTTNNDYNGPAESDGGDDSSGGDAGGGDSGGGDGGGGE